MTGMQINEFMDKIYYGDELEFKIGSTTYFSAICFHQTLRLLNE